MNLNKCDNKFHYSYSVRNKLCIKVNKKYRSFKILKKINVTNRVYSNFYKDREDGKKRNNAGMVNTSFSTCLFIMKI